MVAENHRAPGTMLDLPGRIHWGSLMVYCGLIDGRA
jgi:hypothetical protein